MTYANAVNAYTQTAVTNQVSMADPHQLVNLLMRGALERLAAAKGAIERGDVPTKAQKLSRAVAIISELQGSLNREAGGELANNMYELYDYMVRRLTLANVENDAAIVEEVRELLAQIHESWAALPQQQAKTAPSVAAGA